MFCLKTYITCDDENNEYILGITHVFHVTGNRLNFEISTPAYSLCPTFKSLVLIECDS